uniref:Uncharacterized protein n=1 Tax=Magallana gigas TaxID=29159 RepID=A0A8W8HLS4_MAGGI
MTTTSETSTERQTRHFSSISGTRGVDVWCVEDSSNLVSLAKGLNTELTDKVTTIDEDLLNVLSYTNTGYLSSLCAALGGFVAQEGIKAVTGKFTPLKQWLYLNCRDVINKEEAATPDMFTPR